MTRMVIGPLLLLAAMVSPEARPLPPAPERFAKFQPTSGATGRATASVRIVSAARFGPGKADGAAGGTRRAVRLIERDGTVRSAELLEFQ
jgi:hypothetical protein